MRAAVLGMATLLPALAQAAAAVGLSAMSGTAHAQQQNVYDFHFTGAIYPGYTPSSYPLPQYCAPCEEFTVTFLANSPTLPFPTSGAFFSAGLSAYDVNIVINNQIVQQGGTGSFTFDGTQIGAYPNGAWTGGDWSFSSEAFGWSGTPGFGLGNPDPLNGAGFHADSGIAGCVSTVFPPTAELPVLCSVSGGSSVVPEPDPLALFGASGLGLLLFRRRSRALTKSGA